MLFPFDGGGWFGADVVDYAVDASDLVDDVVGDFSEEVVGEVYPVGCHSVGGRYGAERNSVLVGALIAHDTNRLYGEEDYASLPYLVIETFGAES